MGEAITPTTFRSLLWLFVGLTLLHFAAAGVLAAVQPVWSDELLTYHIARAADAKAIWDILLLGGDQTPPLFHLLTRACLHTFGTTPFVSRLPAMFAYWLMSVCLFAFAVRRLPTSCALAAA